MENIHIYLRDLEERIDPDDEARLLGEWYAFADNQWEQPFFRPRRRAKAASRVEWPTILYNDAYANYDNMGYRELIHMNRQLETGGPEILSYRAGYGTVILPSLFGAEPLLMPYEQNSLPASKPVENAEGIFKAIIAGERTVDVKSGYAAKPFEAARRFRELLDGYPKLQKHCHIYVPDTESPVSIMEAVFGSEFYFLFSDEPEFVHQSLDAIATVFIDFVNAWHREFPPIDDCHRINWGFLHRGHSLLREDAATNLSGDTYREFVFPHDKKIMEALHGGAVHFCGKGDHLIEHFADLPGFYALNMSQPDWNDMGVIYKHTIHKDATIVGLANFEVNRCLREGIDLRGRVEAGLGIPAWMEETEDAPDPATV